MYVKCSSPRYFKRNIAKEGKKIFDFSNNFGSLFVKKTITDSIVQKYILSNPESKDGNIIKSLVTDAAIRSETLSATSGETCLNMASIMMKSLEDKINVEKISDTIKTNSKRLERSDLVSLSNIIFKENSIQSKIVLDIFDTINFTYPVFIERTNHVDTSISISNGFNFKIKVDSRYLKSGKWNRSNVKIFVIDGFIESVGEIHHLLESASSTKQPIVIFARNFSEDVENTILYNFKRGTIDVFPVSVGFDENTLNILNDISICSGANLVSSIKGDLISKSTKEDQAVIDEIFINKSSITITKNNESPMLKSHMSYLTGKRDEAYDTKDLFDIFNKRIRSMISGKAEVKIGTDLYNKDIRIIEKLDLIMRIIRSYMSSGVIYRKDFLGSCKILDDSTVDNFPYPASSIILSSINANSLINSLSSIGHIIYEDR
tara:strand:+ start:277 stop:1575 length:1299 start_codon:yes stop_codon:yes gene_type:complete